MEFDDINGHWIEIDIDFNQKGERIETKRRKSDQEYFAAVLDFFILAKRFSTVTEFNEA